MEHSVGVGRKKGQLFVVSGPSGVGKDAVLDKLFLNLSGIVRSVSATTRPPRPGEIDGKDYHFYTQADFEAGIEQGFFLEWARYGDNLYGTPADRVQQQLAEGWDVVLKIEVQGALEVKKLAPDALLVFLQPPSLAELERRLRSRGTDSEDKIAKRLAIAHSELACIPDYDYLVTNDTLEEAVHILRAIVLAERHRVRKN